jgi:hypothetical protein
LIVVVRLLRQPSAMPTTNSWKKVIPFLLSLFILIACNNNKTKSDKNASPATASGPKNTVPLKRLETLTNTDFVITLESPISQGKNIIYSTSLLYAWDEVEKQLASPVMVGDTNSAAFKTLVASESFRNSLAKSEYSTTGVNLADEIIYIKSAFEKNLHFASRFQQLNEDLFFRNDMVKAFGLKRVPSQDTISTYEILYYKDDDHFVLKLVPGDNNHEIILAKGLDEPANLGAALQQVNNFIAKGKTEKHHPGHEWKYRLGDKDMFAVPVIRFNLETNYKNLENQHFFLKDERGYTIVLASQQNAFTLDEEGSTVKSEAEVAAVVDSVVAMPEVKTYEKNLLCNKTFYIVVKRTDAVNPYFMMKVNNTELLQRNK